MEKVAQYTHTYFLCDSLDRNPLRLQAGGFVLGEKWFFYLQMATDGLEAP